MDQVGHLVVCRSVQNDRWNFDRAVLMNRRIRKAGLNGGVDDASYYAACYGLHERVGQ